MVNLLSSQDILRLVKILVAAARTRTRDGRSGRLVRRRRRSRLSRARTTRQARPLNVQPGWTGIGIFASSGQTRHGARPTANSSRGPYGSDLLPAWRYSSAPRHSYSTATAADNADTGIDQHQRHLPRSGDSDGSDTEASELIGAPNGITATAPASPMFAAIGSSTQ
jgi:hypothetical protein